MRQCGVQKLKKVEPTAAPQIINGQAINYKMAGLAWREKKRDVLSLLLSTVETLERQGLTPINSCWKLSKCVLDGT